MRILIISLLLITACSPSDKEEKEILVNASALEIKSEIESFRGEKAVLVNFWATWCVPCVEEFPDIMELKSKYGEDFELIFVSGDFEEARPEAKEFLKKQDVNFTTYFKVGNDNEFINTISSTWSGALPYTVIYDRNGIVSAEWEGKAEFKTFETELLKVINEG